jgi:hypothetical protein
MGERLQEGATGARKAALRETATKIDVGDGEVRISGEKTALLGLVLRADGADGPVPSFGPGWRPAGDETGRWRIRVFCVRNPCR